MMMTDSASPNDVVQTAFKEIFEKFKDDPKALTNAIRENWNIKDALEGKLGGPIEDIDVLLKIPSLNMVSSTGDLEVLNGNLVRFTGFVQDMIDQDFFLGHLVAKPDDFANSVSLKYLQVKDGDFEGFDEQSIEYSQNNFMMSRGNIICTSIPNENKWLREKRGIEDGTFDEIVQL